MKIGSSKKYQALWKNKKKPMRWLKIWSGERKDKHKTNTKNRLIRKEQEDKELKMRNKEKEDKFRKGRGRKESENKD